MPTLADIYSAIDSAKRRGSDFVRNPGASLQQMLGYANDRARNLNEQTSAATQEFIDTGKIYGPKSEALAMKMAEGYNPIGMTVYHGSPHLFQKFDLAKIGTGEGNQAYGRGMYMAQEPAVAKNYQFIDAKIDPDVVTYGGKSLDSLYSAAQAAQERAYRMPKGPAQQAAIDRANAQLGMWESMMTRNHPKQVIEQALDPEAGWPAQAQFAKTLDMNKFGGVDMNPGNFYKVDLPDTHIRRMLDFDAKLKDQPIAVRRLAKSLGMDLNDLGGDLLAIVGKDEAGKQTLQNAGIRGIKYLDQQSRDATQGTRNFVVFDPNNLTILERNQQPIK